MIIRKNYLICILAAGSLYSHSAISAEKPSVKIGTITSAKQCNVYQGIKSSGTSSVAANYRERNNGSVSAGLSANSSFSFETFFVKDCTSHFEGIRSAFQAAIASSGALIVSPGASNYLLSGRVEDVVPGTSSFIDRSLTGKSYGTVADSLLVTMSLTLSDKNGRIVFGAPIVASIETGSADITRSTVSANQISGNGLYSLLQRNLANIAARKVAFHINPLSVIQGAGKNIQLNYGAPLIVVGTQISVTSADGSAAARYRITSVTDGSSLAQQIGDANSSKIGIGSHASVIEKGDPAENQNTTERVELP